MRPKGDLTPTEEREAVIRDLLDRLADVGIEPGEGFYAEYTDAGWMFRASKTGASSSSAGVPDGPSIQARR